MEGHRGGAIRNASRRPPFWLSAGSLPCSRPARRFLIGSGVPPAAAIDLGRRWWLARRLRPQLVEDRPQHPNAIAERVLGPTDELDQLDGQDGLFFVRQVKVRHNPDMGW